MVSWYHDIIMIMKINWTCSANQILIWDFDIAIDLFTEYHDIVMLSWYIKLSTPFTLSQIRANVVDFDIAIDNSMISWCCDIIMVVYQWENQNIISSYERWSIMVLSKTLQESYERNIDISKMIVMIDNMIFCNKYETFYPSSSRFIVTILPVSLCGHNFSLTLITGKHCYHF